MKERREMEDNREDERGVKYVGQTYSIPGLNQINISFLGGIELLSRYSSVFLLGKMFLLVDSTGECTCRFYRQLWKDSPTSCR